MTDLSDWLSAKIGESIRCLLETKHLYQALVIDQQALLNKLQAELISKQLKGGFDDILAKAAEALNDDWRTLDEVSRQRPRYNLPGGVEYQSAVSIFIRSINASCSTCKTVMPMNLKGANNLVRDSDGRWETIEDRTTGHQDFVFVFQCQRCRSQPDTFLVRRQDMRLTLCGRAPMEYVEVPASVPKPVRMYYSDAVVAANSGKMLAGFLYLRVLIEQHVRSVIGDSEGLKADEALAKYSAQLPEGVRDWLPSLKERYGLLSEAIHSASEEADLFVESLDKIANHFKGLEVYKETRA